tara:strand:- start:176 stop:283 length:108 start_codon:yes stop_codon:yes gene_type:complete
MTFFVGALEIVLKIFVYLGYRSTKKQIVSHCSPLP